MEIALTNGQTKQAIVPGSHVSDDELGIFYEWEDLPIAIQTEVLEIRTNISNEMSRLSTLLAVDLEST